MKKLNLNLNKQSIVILTTGEAQNVKGGRGKWSNRHGGNCRYSRLHPIHGDCNDGTGDTGCIIGCKTNRR